MAKTKTAREIRERGGWQSGPAAGRSAAAAAGGSARGLTLLELLVCLALVGILAGTAGLQFAQLSSQWQLRDACLRVVGELIRARAAAPGVSGGAAVRVEGKTLVVRDGSSVRRVSLPEGVAVDLNSGGEVRFSSSGLAENATFRLHNRFGERSVVVNQRGRVRVQ